MSVNERLPDAVPTAVGVNVTATVQVAAAATGFEVEQVVPELAMANGPVTVIAVNVRLPVPVLVRVTVCAALVVPDIWAEKVSEGDDKLIKGAVPVPLKVTVCVLPATPLLLSVMVSTPVSGPVAVGEKVT